MIVADLGLAWVTTRAAGTAALLTSTGSVLLGLALAGRMPTGRGRLGDVRVLHQTLGIATMVALTIHMLTLLIDPWLSPSVLQLLIPFQMDYRPLWTGVGILAAYGFLVFGMSGYLRKRLGKRWNVIHRFTGLAWVMAVAHTLGAGSDAGQAWYLLVVALCVVPVVGLATYRIAQARGARASVPASAGAEAHARRGGSPAPVRTRGSVAPPAPRGEAAAPNLWAHPERSSPNRS
ncbi:MAG: ferric reductase-like transmembrane domain-containing protein [Solirubrobacteraceae bacterium]|nr:ferric reductase-like transmembrane domain-containing protein [Solirubrobacteraceae bacterium]